MTTHYRHCCGCPRKQPFAALHARNQVFQSRCPRGKHNETSHAKYHEGNCHDSVIRANFTHIQYMSRFQESPLSVKSLSHIGSIINSIFFGTLLRIARLVPWIIVVATLPETNRSHPKWMVWILLSFWKGPFLRYHISFRLGYSNLTVNLLQNQHRSAAKSPALEFTDGMETVIVFTDATLERTDTPGRASEVVQQDTQKQNTYRRHVFSNINW